MGRGSGKGGGAGGGGGAAQPPANAAPTNNPPASPPANTGGAAVDSANSAIQAIQSDVVAMIASDQAGNRPSGNAIAALGNQIQSRVNDALNGLTAAQMVQVARDFGLAAPRTGSQARQQLYLTLRERLGQYFRVQL